MKITCQSCQSKYTVSDDKVQGKTVKIKCRKCGSTIVVNSSGVATTSGSSGADSAGADSAQGAADTFLVNVAEGDQRSMTLQEIVDAYNSSVVNAETYVWADGMADWMPLSQVEAITSQLSSAAPAAAAPRAAARREVARPAQDVFSSSEDKAKRSDDVATSAPMFKSGGGGGAAAAAKPKAEENSMLFSLSALTSKAAPAASSGTKPPANSEDSGIIDLKALAAAAESRNKSQSVGLDLPASSGIGALVPEEGGLFLAPPVLSAAPPAPAVVSPIEAPQKNRTPLFIGIGGAVAVVAIVGAFMVMKGGGEPPPAPAAENTAPAATPTPTPTPEPPPPPAVDPAAAAAAAAASASAAKMAANKPGGGGAKPGGAAVSKPAVTSGGGSSGGATAPATPAAKPRGNCNCPPGDLMCAMKCSTK